MNTKSILSERVINGEAGVEIPALTDEQIMNMDYDLVAQSLAPANPELEPQHEVTGGRVISVGCVDFIFSPGGRLHIVQINHGSAPAPVSTLLTDDMRKHLDKDDGQITGPIRNVGPLSLWEKERSHELRGSTSH
jgi:hypothetical protein